MRSDRTRALLAQLNATLGDAALDAVLRGMGQPTIRKDRKKTYYHFRDDGVSLLFDRKSALKIIFL